MTTHSPAPAPEPDRLNSSQDLAAIYERYAPGLFRYLYFRVGDEEQARDILSEVFLRMIESHERYEERGWPISAWLYRIAHDRAVDCIRRRSRRRHLSLESYDAPVAGPESLLDRHEAAAMVQRSMATLCTTQRQVIHMRYFDDLSVQEVAQQLGRSEGAVKAIQHRGMRAMEHHLLRGSEHPDAQQPKRRRAHAAPARAC
jgi:RNA polymerase sigma-70 factor, ECF subfamily